ncbi:hypothetical protein K7432_008973 [Basidiobolus ranarum]|uniref:BZIP domain-containing protein n=1 Tax=Basidiobolus ranarum TaxID=34480 RepID=A0ABR2WQY7_9FUNG
MLSPKESLGDMSDSSKSSGQDFFSEDSANSPEMQLDSPALIEPPQKKKPGRKPNPASPALRKAQNRAAQRAFRERKDRHLKELEECVKELRDGQHKVQNELRRENQKLRYLIQILKNDNVQLRNLVSGLNNPLVDTVPCEVMPSTDKNMNSNIFAPSANTSNINSVMITPVTLSNGCLPSSNQRNSMSYPSLSYGGDVSLDLYEGSYLSGMEYSASSPCTSMISEFGLLESNEKSYYTSNVKSLDIDGEDKIQDGILEGSYLPIFPDGIALTIPPPDFGSINGGVAMNLMPAVREPKYMFKEYDPRIDRVPSERLKELMIEQQGNYDIDELWELITTKAICHGDPQDPSAWELPDEFYTRFPMLVDPALKTRERMRAAWWRLNGRIKHSEKMRSLST